MARARNIKPGFFLNDKLAELHPLARILFEGLWCLADREGRLIDNPKRIKAQILPYDDCDVDKFLDDLANSSEKFIVRYEVDGQKCIQVSNFTAHQNPHKNEAPSSIPAYSEEEQEKHSTSTVQIPEDSTTNPADSLLLIPDSLNSDSFKLDEGDTEQAETELFPQETTQTEKECLNLLKNTFNYPYNYEKDLQLIRDLSVEFPELNLLEELKKWAHRKKYDDPLKKDSKPRGQIRNWLIKAKEFKKAQKGREPTNEHIRPPTKQYGTVL